MKCWYLTYPFKSQVIVNVYLLYGCKMMILDRQLNFNVFFPLVPRQLSMMLMLAQSNPQLFALIGTKANINKELERIEQFTKLQQLTAADLLSRNKRHWTEWLEKYK